MGRLCAWLRHAAPRPLRRLVLSGNRICRQSPIFIGDGIIPGDASCGNYDLGPQYLRRDRALHRLTAGWRGASSAPHLDPASPRDRTTKCAPAAHERRTGAERTVGGYWRNVFGDLSSTLAESRVAAVAMFLAVRRLAR